MVLIRKGENSKVTADFKEKEYFNASYGITGDSFLMDEKVIQGGQIIRDYFDVPGEVNSSFRTRSHELLMGRSGNSQHVLKRAVDYDYPEAILLKYHQEILNKGALYHLLRKAGITGFGLYDGFIHIDSRINKAARVDQYGNYAFWDKRVTTKKKV